MLNGEAVKILENIKREILISIVAIASLVSCGEASVGVAPSGDVTALAAYSDEVLGQSSVVVAVGTSHDLYVTENYPDADILRVENISDIVAMVESGKVEYGVADRANVLLLSSDVASVEIVNDEIFSSHVGGAFNRDKGALRDEFNDFLRKFKGTATYEDMHRRWHIDGSGGDIPTIDIPKTGEHLTVAALSDAPPAGVIINNRLEGFDVELVRHFAAERGYDLELVTYNFAGVLSAVITGQVDMAFCEIAITEERKKSMLFSDSYLDLPACVFRKRVALSPKYIDFEMPEVKPSVADGVATKMDSIGAVINGRRVAVMEGTVHDVFLAKHFPKAVVQTYNEVADMTQALESGRADFILYNDIGVRLMQKKQPSIFALFTDFEQDYIGYGVSKSNPELLDELNIFLKEYNEDGGVDRIVKRWLDQLDDGRVEGVELDGDCDRSIKVGTSGLTVPFSFVVDGRLEGADIEIISLFCKNAGYNLEFVQMPFGSLIAALTTGKIDMIANCLLETAERAKVLNFTTSYSKHGFVLAANRRESEIHSQKESFVDRFTTSFERNIIKEDRYKLILGGLWVTIVISLFSILLGTILGMIVCYMAMHRSVVVRSFARGYITIIRGTPVLVLLMINFYIVFAKTALSAEAVAVISFAVNFAAYVSEMFRTSIESIDRGQSEAGLAMGFTKVKTFLLIVAPQAIARVLPIYKGECISLVKMTSIVGYIAVQDVTKVGDIIRSRTFDAFFPLIVSALLYFLLAYLFTKILDLLTVKKNNRL